MLTRKYVIKNKTNTIFWDIKKKRIIYIWLEDQTIYGFRKRIKTCHLIGFTVSSKPQSKKKSVKNFLGRWKRSKKIRITLITLYLGHGEESSIVWKRVRGHRNHHHIALVARISLTLSRHSSLSFIALGRSSGQHPVSSHSCWMYVRAGRPAFWRPCVGIHKSTSLMSSSLLLQQCPACLVRLTWIVFVIGGRWPYSWCLVGCCCQDLFRIARSILV